MSLSTTLPHWDMSVVYAGLDSPEFARDLGAVLQSVQTLATQFDQLGIAKTERSALTPQQTTAFETIVKALNAVVEQTTTLRAYIQSFVTTNAANDVAQARQSEFQKGMVTLTKLMTRLIAWIGSLDVDALLKQSSVAQEYAFMLRKAQQRAFHLMQPIEEDLAAELNLSSGSAWSKLYGNLSSQIMVPFQAGEKNELPMSVVRNLAYDSDRSVRQKAYEAELVAWEKNALPLASALNGIKGEVLTLCKRRGWGSPLDATLLDNAIDRQTLDAMMEAMREAFPDFRRYLRAKARMLGQEKLPWFDLFAPVSSTDREWSYPEAMDLIVGQFGSYSQQMSDFAARAFRENWIDAEPRKGKQDGAFCMYLRKDESRILSNYRPSFKSVTTLAHELGHAYHNFNLSTQAMLNRETPMILAETASIFCETIVRQAILKTATQQEQIEVLEGSLMGACQVVVDITSRFLFESRVFAQRQKRELSVAELCELMRQSQIETYGDGLDEKVLHPSMWAAKVHYYSTGRSFYNFPYAFGLLFGLGLYARYRQDANGFKAGYDRLLASTGRLSPADLAAGMGIDIRSKEFWCASLDTIRQDVAQFEKLI